MPKRLWFILLLFFFLHSRFRSPLRSRLQSHPYQFVHVIEIYTSCVFFQQLFRVSIPFNYDLSIVKNTRSYRRWFTILFIFDWAIEVRILTFDSIHHIDLYVRYSISDVSIYLIVMERLFRDAFFFWAFQFLWELIWKVFEIRVIWVF